MREHFLDRIRIVLTILMIAHHCAITYGASGSWFIKLAPGDGAAALALTLLTAVIQAVVPGFFFLIAGYFTPISYDRKGWANYLRGRLVRLGIPTLVFGFILGPLTVAIANSHDEGDFLRLWLALMSEGRFVIGPMWFALALLLFSTGYVLWRRFVPFTPGPKKPVPPRRRWVIAALGVGFAAFLIRQVVPVGVEILNLQLGYFASYIFLFALGCYAERYGWLSNIKQRHAVPWLRGLVVAIPALPLALLVGEWLGQTDFTTGLSLPALVYAFWEPFVAWGMIAGMLWFFRLKWSERDQRIGVLARRTYGAFILHPPIIVTLARAFETVPAPSMVKFPVLVIAGSVLSFTMAWAARKIRMVKRVV